jgi:hypothetical protein
MVGFSQYLVVSDFGVAIISNRTIDDGIQQAHDLSDNGQIHAAKQG